MVLYLDGEYRLIGDILLLGLGIVFLLSPSCSVFQISPLFKMRAAGPGLHTLQVSAPMVIEDLLLFWLHGYTFGRCLLCVRLRLL